MAFRNKYGGSIKEIRDKVGMTDILDTTAQSIVGAINEVNGTTSQISSMFEDSGSNQPTVVWTHPRSSEIFGSRDFSLASVTGCMMYEKFDTDMTFDIIEFPCRVSANTKTLIFRVYEFSAFPAGYGFNPTSLSSYLKAEISITGDSLNLSASGLQSVTLDSAITITAGNVCAIGIALSTPESSVFIPRYWNSADETTTYSGTADTYTSNSTIYVATTDSPHRRGFYCYNGGGTGDWSAAWYPYEGNFYAATFRLKKTSSGFGFSWDNLSGTIPESKIEDGSIGIEKLADSRQNKLCIPSTIYSVVNLQTNLYFDNMVEDNVENHLFEVTGTIGTVLDECFRIAPTASGSYTIGINVYDKKMNLENSQSVSLSVADTTKTVSKTILVMGDSIIANGSNSGMITYALEQLLTSDTNTSVTLIGTQGSGTNKHEGRAGWAVADFAGSSSPFYSSGTFNFSNYMSTNSFAACDVVFIHLGINDVFSLSSLTAVETKFNTNITNIDAMIASMKTYNANIKVCLLLPIMPPKDTNLALAYPNTGFSTWKYKQRINYYSSLLIDKYDERQSENIYVLPFGTSLDTARMFPVQTAVANSHTTDTVSRQNNLHPTDNGYAQLADSLYAFLKNI